MQDPYWCGLYLCSARYNLETCLSNLGTAYMRGNEQERQEIKDYQDIILKLQERMRVTIKRGKQHD